MPDISVHITEDLKDRMDREKGEDWSLVATLAFEKRLAELFQNTTISDMEAAIRRLQACREEYHLAVSAEGYQAGRRWAESAASFAQLKRLCEFTDKLDSGPSHRWTDFFGGDDAGALTASEILACYIQGLEPDQGVARDFWRAALERVAPPEPEFLHDFAEGATEVYHAVADRLQSTIR